MVRLAIALLLAVTAPAFAQSPDEEELGFQIYGGMAREAIACWSYYTIAAQCTRESGRYEEEVPKKLDAAADYVLQLGLSYSERAGLEEAVPKAWADLHTKDMMEGIKGDCANAPVLMNRFSNLCEEAVNDPVKRSDVWRERVLEATGQAAE